MRIRNLVYDYGNWIRGATSRLTSGWYEKGWIDLNRTASFDSSNNALTSPISVWAFRTTHNDAYSDNSVPTNPDITQFKVIVGKVWEVGNDDSQPLGGIPAIGTQNLRVQYQRTGYDDVFTTTVLPDQNGRFAVLLPSDVTSQVLLSCDRTLKKLVNVSSLTGWSSLVKLRYGDFNGDNQIDGSSEPTAYQYDLARLNKCINGTIDLTTLLSSSNSIYRYDSSCDLNGDGTVSNADSFLFLGQCQPTSTVTGDSF